LDNWIAGKTILIGDAAHAITPRESGFDFDSITDVCCTFCCPDLGQGCNIAIEDAEALGYLFRDIMLPASYSTNGAPAPEITKQLAIFQSVRMKRAHLIQGMSRQAARMQKGEVKEMAGESDRAAFRNAIYSYTGFKAAYKAHLDEEKN
jgi:salicylate hydroxylase